MFFFLNGCSRNHPIDQLFIDILSSETFVLANIFSAQGQWRAKRLVLSTA